MFNTPSLKKSYERNKSVIDNISKNLDLVTSEINTLEKYLQDANLLDNFEYLLPSYEFDSRVLATQSTDDELTNKRFLFLVQRGLRWDRSTKKIKYIQFEFNHGLDHSGPNSYIQQDYFDNKVFELNSLGGWDTSAPDHNKSLLETRFQIRKQMLPHLGDFLTAIAEAYNILNVDLDEKPEPLYTDYELPF